MGVGVGAKISDLFVPSNLHPNLFPLWPPLPEAPAIPLYQLLLFPFQLPSLFLRNHLYAHTYTNFFFN